MTYILCLTETAEHRNIVRDHEMHDSTKRQFKLL